MQVLATVTRGRVGLKDYVPLRALAVLEPVLQLVSK